MLAALTVAACVLPSGSEDLRILESSWRIERQLEAGVETLTASWLVPAKVKLGNRFLQVSGRLSARAPDGSPLPRRVIVCVDILDAATGERRKRYRLVVDRSPENGFREVKKFPKIVAGDSLVTVTVEPVGTEIPAGVELTLCVDVVGRRVDLSGFPSCAAGGAPTTLAGIQVSVFSGTCAVSGCHDSITAERGLVLETGQSWANLVGVRATQSPAELRVRAGDSERSYLVKKLRGTNNIGGRMPLGGPFLTETQIAGIVEWIEKGALDN